VKKIAAVSFLNARPITYGLEQGLGDDRFELSFELPSRCAELLERGEVDLGLIPSASYAAASGELRIVPGIAIAGFGPVRTVLLVGEVPWSTMKTIALDGASRSSAMLLRLLCRDRGLTPRFREVPHDEVLDAASGTTGALVIGDAGFAAAARFPHAVDLGAAWRDATGLPFVYAVLAGRPGAVGPDDIACLQESLSQGLARAPPSRAPGPRRTAAIPPTTNATCSATSATRWAPRSCPACRRSSIARARRAAAAPVRPRLFEARARIAPAPSGAPSRSIDALLRTPRGRAPVARRRAPPLRRRARAGAGRRRRRPPPGAAPRRRGHLHHRSQRQLHERLRDPLQVLQLLPAAHQQDRRLRAVARGAHAEVPGDRSTSAACRSCCRAG
jgi:predicted solute-binding protein